MTNESGRQREIDFTAAERKRISAHRDVVLENAVLRKDKRVSATIRRRTLMAINSFGNASGWSFPSIKTLAKKVVCSEKQISRAIHSLKRDNLLCIEKRKTSRGNPTNHYTIIWGELERLTPERLMASRRATTGQSASNHRTVAPQPPDSCAPTTGQLRPDHRTLVSHDPLGPKKDPPPPSGDWAKEEEVKAALLRCGLSAATLCINGGYSRTTGEYYVGAKNIMTDDDALQIVAEYERTKAKGVFAYTPNALFARLNNKLDAWPPATDVYHAALAERRKEVSAMLDHKHGWRPDQIASHLPTIIERCQRGEALADVVAEIVATEEATL